MKFLIKSFAVLVALAVMLVVGFLLTPAASLYANVPGQPVFVAGSWVLVEAYTSPVVSEKIRLTVAPANLPGHLNLYFGYDIEHATFARLLVDLPGKTGGFQNVEIVRLIKPLRSPQRNLRLRKDNILLPV